jgi:ATP-dependent DNA helicase RecQ
MKQILFFDLEVEPGSAEAGKNPSKIKEIGAWFNGAHFRDTSIKKFEAFAQKARYICGHNIIDHDLPILKKNHITSRFFRKHWIDTLYLSALLFPQNPYHKLVKDYKLVSEEPNNPVSDSKLAERLLTDCTGQFRRLDGELTQVYKHLLKDLTPFGGFFTFLKETGNDETGTRRAEAISDSHSDTDMIIESIGKRFKENLCKNCDFKTLIKNNPLELAYALALFNAKGSDSVPPSWLVFRHPEVLQVFHRLRFNRCKDETCTYCGSALDAKTALKRIFGFDGFREFEGDTEIPLQEQAVNAALDNKSFLAVFPTGGGKSLTFQLPALMKGEACRTLTVVISPLQSLMKDQVDILRNRHERTDAVAINGLLSPLERAEAIEKVETGGAHILYISPESLRSNTMKRIIRNRDIDRFVIDEAHCFSSWGQDFRVDYQYIGEFLEMLKKEKNLSKPIPVSCFTATAKPTVIEDIKNYFTQKTGVELEVFKTTPKRKNLTFGVLYASGPQEKFSMLLDLLSQDDEPKIVYTTRVRRSEELAAKLVENGFNAAAYNGRMPSDFKIKIQNDFMSGKINIIAATSAFGMGIDKDNVSMVIHYNISDSLENYMQEAGRAGRDKKIKATCYVLFDDSDLMGHFHLLNATRINKKEIYQVWQGIKKIKLEKFSRSALELAKTAGWDTELVNCEMRVKTALAALEDSGLIKRGQNQTRIYATGLLVKNMEQAVNIIGKYKKFDETDRLHATRIIKFIITYNEVAVDFIADALGLRLADTKRLINELKGLRIIGDDRDLTAYIDTTAGSRTHSKTIFKKFSNLEIKLLEATAGDINVRVKKISLKDINSRLKETAVESDIESLRTLLFLWESRKLVKKIRLDRRNHLYKIEFKKPFPEIKKAVTERLELARRVLEKLEINAAEADEAEFPPSPRQTKDTLVEFSMGELRTFAETNQLFKKNFSVTDYDKTLLYLNDISAIKLDRGLFVYYTPYTVTRRDMDNKRQYTKKDYEKFEAFYRHKIEHVHIVGEYAKKLSENYKEAMTFVEDYFTLDYAVFIKKYFPGRLTQIRKPITQERFNEIYKDLSAEQLKIINDNRSKAILVAAGPGSGKTRVLIHKVASLLTLEDVRTEQFLMLTYSRAAAVEMRERLRALLGQTANYIDIYTFHSFAFTVAELKGDLEQSAEIIPRAIEMIKTGQAANKVENKSVLVVDEFQDIGADEFAFIQAVVKAAKDIRVLAVGDDDQNIFEFRGSSTRYMNTFKKEFKAQLYPLNTNYRSKDNLAQFSNLFIKRLPERIKADQTLVSAAPGENGGIAIFKYKSSGLITPLVKNAADVTAKQDGAEDRTYARTFAVLTATNEEALQVYSLLRGRDVKAKLLVSYADFSLKSLVELKMFSHFLEQAAGKNTGRFIRKEQWQDAREQLREKFSRSKQLDLALTVIDSFEKEYKSHELPGVDWREYLEEVRLEDFVFPEKDTVFVSTMHKAKGKEFDHVFLLLDNFKIVSDEKIRVIYVAVTRAKENLSIHTNLGIFDNLLVPGQSNYIDNSLYSAPERLSLQMTYRDVYLDYFTNEAVVETVKTLQAGDPLTVSQRDPRLVYADGREVLMFSAAASENLKKFVEKGYVIQSILAEYIVIWKKKEDNRQYRVVLPRVELKKNG